MPDDRKVQASSVVGSSMSSSGVLRAPSFAAEFSFIGCSYKFGLVSVAPCPLAPRSVATDSSGSPPLPCAVAVGPSQACT